MARVLDPDVFAEAEHVFHQLHAEGHTLPHPEAVTFGLGGRCGGVAALADYQTMPDHAGFWQKAAVRLGAPYPQPIAAFVTALLERRVIIDDIAVERDWHGPLATAASDLGPAQAALADDVFHRHLLWWQAADLASQAADGDPRHAWLAVRAMMALTATGQLNPFDRYLTVS